MRRSSRIAAPVFLIGSYYLAIYLLARALVWLWPNLLSYLPVGGLEDLIDGGSNQLEVIATYVRQPLVGSVEAVTLALAMVGAVLVMTPISWVYFMTTRTKDIDRSFAQTMMVLPVIVAGIAVIVQNSLALAFSLAGVVAAVRFRFSLSEPAHALYIFVSIGIGLGAGIGAMDIAYVVSVGFVAVNLALWKLNYGSDLTTPFFAFLTGRGRDDNDL